MLFPKIQHINSLCHVNVKNPLVLVTYLIDKKSQNLHVLFLQINHVNSSAKSPMVEFLYIVIISKVAGLM